MTYSHTQTAPLYWLLIAVAAVMAGAAVTLQATPPGALVVGASAVLVGLLAFCTRSLTVEDAGDALRVRFGPLPLLGCRIGFREVEDVRQARSSWIDGWGVHFIPGRGWTYNLWGFDCVELTVGGRRLRIGTDDPEGLTAFIRRRIATDRREP